MWLFSCWVFIQRFNSVFLITRAACNKEKIDFDVISDIYGIKEIGKWTNKQTGTHDTKKHFSMLILKDSYVIMCFTMHVHIHACHTAFVCGLHTKFIAEGCLKVYHAIIVVVFYLIIKLTWFAMFIHWWKVLHVYVVPFFCTDKVTCWPIIRR